MLGDHQENVPKSSMITPQCQREEEQGAVAKVITEPSAAARGQLKGTLETAAGHQMGEVEHNPTLLATSGDLAVTPDTCSILANWPW